MRDYADLLINIMVSIMFAAVIVMVLAGFLSFSQAEEVRVYNDKHELQYVIKENIVYDDQQRIIYQFERNKVERYDPATKTFQPQKPKPAKFGEFEPFK